MAIKLVVGADKGIAHAVARRLHEGGDDVIAACMFGGSDLAELGITVVPGIDVTSDEAVDGLHKRLAERGVTLDWLMHVAGVMALDRLESVDFDDMHRQFEINTIGPLRTVRALADLLVEGSKVGIVTSRVGSLGDNSSGGDYAYRVSKAGANMVALNLHHDLSPRGVAVLALHPGTVSTDLVTVIDPADRERYAAMFITAEVAAERLVDVMNQLTPETSGRFRHANGEYLPW